MYRQYVDLLSYRALAELKRDSSGMYLGMLWWILEPMLNMVVFYLIFGLGLRKGGTDFVFYLLCGLVPWKWIDSTVRTSAGIILSSAGLMRQVYFPKWLLPGYIILANTYKFFIVFFLLILALLLSGIKPSSVWFALPGLIAIQFFFIASLAFIASALVPLIPDLRFVVTYGMTMLFFMSGVFFTVSELGEPVRTWLSWIPTVLIIEAYRDVLLYGVWPDYYLLLKIIVPTVFLLFAGVGLLSGFNRYYPRIVG